MSHKIIVLLVLINITLGISMHVFDGYPNRYSASELAVFDKYNYTDKAVWDCQNDPRVCQDLENEDSQIVIWGDSHATSVASGFLHKNYDFLRLFAEAGCPPLSNAIRTDLREFKSCPEHNERALNYISASTNPLYIIISARWSYYLAEENISIEDESLTMKAISKELQTIAARSPQHMFYIIGQIPESHKNLLEVHRNNTFGNRSVSVFNDISSNIKFNTNFRSLKNVKIVDPKSLICDANRKCQLYLSNGDLALFDKDHPTKFYAAALLEQMNVANF